MKARIYISMKKALEEGTDIFGDHHIDFTPDKLSPEQRVELAKSPIDNGSFVVNTEKAKEAEGLDISSLPGVVNANIDTLSLLLNARIKAREEERRKRAEKERKLTAEKEKQIQDWLKKDPETLIYKHSRRQCWTEYDHSLSQSKPHTKTHPEVTEKRKDIESLLIWMNLELDIEKIRNKKAREATQKAAEEVETRLINRWLGTMATVSQQERYKADVLPETELKNGLRDMLFAPLKDFARYKPLKRSDVCDCAYQDVDFLSDKKDDATEHEYETLRFFKRIMPDATVELRYHEGHCEHCDATKTRSSIWVCMDAGTFDLTREYAIIG